jgi:tripartite-type tricarboxylate transporter receptor subunit TctC
VHLTGEVFRAAAGVQIQFVHYRGGGPALQAVMNGEAHLTAVSTAEALGQVAGGAVRALAVSVPERSPVLPEVPTSARRGCRLPAGHLDRRGRPGAHAPGSRRIAERRLQRRGAAARAAAHRARAADQGPRSPRRTKVDAFVRAELDRYSSVLREAGVRPE